MRWTMLLVAAMACAGKAAREDTAVASAPPAMAKDSVPEASPPANSPPAAHPPGTPEPAPGAKRPEERTPSRELPSPTTSNRPTPAPPDEPAGRAPAGTRPAGDADSAKIARLEAQARALARSGGCSTAGDCRAAPVGNRPCGGPRTYLVYCRTTTDSAALSRVLAELARAENARNRHNNVVSTCEFREPPPVELSGGRCVAARQ